MTVSIIIPCYRQGRFLAQAVDSCLGQTHRDVEVIVVNDGSDDDTDEVARSYGDRIVYVHKENGGVSAARNSGIAVATGRYAKFLDADDHLAPEQIAWQMEAVGGRQDRLSVTTARVYEDGKPAEYTDTVPRLADLMPGMLSFPDIPPLCFLVPMDLVKAVGGFRLGISPAEDWDFWCRVGLHRPGLVCDERVGCYYRKWPGSISMKQRRKTTVAVAGILSEFHDRFRDASGAEREWFGRELLGAEQATYRRLLIGGYGEVELERELLKRIQELWGEVGPPAGVSGKFLALRRVVGYPLAERAYSGYVRYRSRG